MEVAAEEVTDGCRPTPLATGEWAACTTGIFFSGTTIVGAEVLRSRVEFDLTGGGGDRGAVAVH